jgi:hypothetical protein
VLRPGGDVCKQSSLTVLYVTPIPAAHVMSCLRQTMCIIIFPFNYGPKLGRVQPSDASKLYYCYRFVQLPLQKLSTVWERRAVASILASRAFNADTVGENTTYQLQERGCQRDDVTVPMPVDCNSACVAWQYDTVLFLTLRSLEGS